MQRPFLCALLLAMLAACGDSADTSSPNTTADAGADANADTGGGDDDATQDAADGERALSVSVTRDTATPRLSPFTLEITVLDGDVPVEDEPPEVTASKGALGPVEAIGAGVYRCTITPSESGEHPFTVTSGAATYARTALVMAEAAEGVGQAMAVPGLVNTQGYEDGVTITPDGEYIFVQTGPAYFSGLIVFQIPRAQGGCGGHRTDPTPCDHPWVNQTIGPYSAPERPGFFDGRINADGTWRHNSNLYQVPDGGTPNFPIPTMFYGFKRQPDGTFAEPFYVAFEDANDAIINPFGLSFRPNGDGTATTLFTVNDPSDTPSITDVDDDGDGQPDGPFDSGFDVYTTEITLGQDNALGRFEPGARQLEILRADFPPTKLGFGDTGPDGNYGTQGNSHLHFDANGRVQSVWTDDEFDANPNSTSHADYHDLAVYVLDGDFPAGPWTKVVLPDKVNTSAEQIQPFFTGDGLLYTEDTNIVFAPYSGPQTAAGYADADNWGDPCTC